MYEAQFGLERRPFPAVARVDTYFPSASTRSAHETLARCIRRGDGPGLIIGPVGTGKTLLCQLLAEEFRNEFRVVVLSSTRLCTRRALLQAMLYELQLPFRDLEEGELRLSLIDHVVRSEACPHGLLLLVDEAHCLPLVLLEEIRMITNLVRDGQPRVRLVLAGTPALEERFASPHMESFNQRVVARCYLEPLGGQETAAYVRGQVSLAGGDPDRLFDDEALAAIYRATHGVPRLINQLSDHALILAAAGGGSRIDGPGVEEAWADLQQLPTPSHLRCVADSRPHLSVVEFGTLSSEPEAGATRPEHLAAETEQRLDEIQARVDAVRRDALDELPGGGADDERTAADSAGQGGDDRFVPAGTIGPEIELVFHGPHAPFFERYSEEEVVLDHYAVLQGGRASSWPRVSSGEGQAIATILKASTAATDPGAARRGARDPDYPGLDPASDPVLPEPSDELLVVHAGQRPGPEAVALAAEAAAAATRARKKEFQRLFTGLRRR